MARSANKDDGILNLVQRLDIALASPQGRIIAFISARTGEGTSTIARDYARALADSVDHKILLIDAGKFDKSFFDQNRADPSTTISDTVLAGRNLDDALYFIGTHVQFGRWAGEGRGRERSVAAKLLNDEKFWSGLRQNFGTVVIDAPSFQDSPDGIALAARADATVIIVEAETTRQPVIENLRDTLNAAGAKVVGMVMNKRIYYIPASVYEKM